MKNKKRAGDTYVLMQSSIAAANDHGDTLLGVFQPRAYIVITSSGFVCFTPVDDAVTDILDDSVNTFSSCSTKWEPKFISTPFQEPEDDYREFLLPVDMEFLLAHAPQKVIDMIKCVLAGLGKLKE